MIVTVELGAGLPDQDAAAGKLMTAPSPVGGLPAPCRGRAGQPIRRSVPEAGGGDPPAAPDLAAGGADPQGGGRHLREGRRNAFTLPRVSSQSLDTRLVRLPDMPLSCPGVAGSLPAPAPRWQAGSPDPTR
ncbi:hypothetical protein SDC9_31439 [bioreactor metagenome]|uniref:Uncharacterized protein n=1 Tax=bioreactor metagenome TaxID=1076179 RepID=A0A644V2R8_9ZZZZ